MGKEAFRFLLNTAMLTPLATQFTAGWPSINAVNVLAGGRKMDLLLAQRTT